MSELSIAEDDHGESYMPGRADARAAAARRAAQARMRAAATRLREHGEVGDPPGARDAAARLLDQLAERDDLDTHTFDRAAYLADRVLTRPIDQLADDARPLPAGYNNGQPTSQRRQHRPAAHDPWVAGP